MDSVYLSRMIDQLKGYERHFAKVLAEETERLQRASVEVAKNQAALDGTRGHLRLLEAELERLTQAERGEA